MSPALPIPADVLVNLQREAALELVKNREELPWPDRGALPPSRTPAPGMPPDLLPRSVAAYILSEAAGLGACIEFVAVPLVIAAGSLLGRSLTVRPRRRNRWTITPNLWGGSIGRPSAMKSPSGGAGLLPLRRIAAAALEEHLAAQAASKARADVLKARRDSILRQARKASDVDGMTRDVADLDAQIEAARLAGTRRRHIVNDCTVEALQNILSENPRGVLQTRDELAGFFSTLSKDGHEADKPFYLEAYEGGLSGGYESDRIARGNVRAPSPCLSIFGTIQPGRIARLVAGAIAGKDGADGFLQRFQLLVWPDEPGEGRGEDRPPDAEALATVVSIFKLIDAGDRTGAFGAEREDGSPDFLRFSPTAQNLFEDWLEEHFDSVRAAGDSPAFEEYLVKQRKTVPALALIFHALDVAAGLTPAGPISVGALDLAMNWVAFLRVHAEKLYAVELRQAETAAQALANRLVRRRVPDGLTINDIAERDWSGLDSPALLHGALDVLEPLGWIRREFQVTPGRTRTVVRIHPEFRDVLPPEEKEETE